MKNASSGGYLSLWKTLMCRFAPGLAPGRAIAAGLAAVLGLALASCGAGFAIPSRETRVSLYIASSTARSWLPAGNRDTAKYDVTLTQGDSSVRGSFLPDSAGWNSPALAAGSWELKVVGYNSDGVEASEASASFELAEGETKSLSMSMRPVAGNGTVKMYADIASASLAAGAVDVSFADSTGTGVSVNVLAADASLGGALSSETELPAGDYAAKFVLRDGTAVKDTLFGACVVAKGCTTTISLGLLEGGAPLLDWDASVPVADPTDPDNPVDPSPENPNVRYATNPDGRVGKYSATMNVSCANGKSDGFGDWTSDMLIAQGASNDIAQSFRGDHEAPVYDTYALYAAWDDSNLYLGWQFVNVVDVVDPAQGYPVSDNGKPWNGDIPQIIALDVDPAVSSAGTLASGDGVWAAAGKVFNKFGNGMDRLLMFSSKPGVGKPGVFRPDASGFMSYADAYVSLFSAAGVVYGYVDGRLPSIASVYGVNKPGAWAGYTPSLLLDSTQFVDLVPLGHKDSQDTFYEMKIPFAALGITRAQLEQKGIGVMHVSTFGESGIGSIPYDAAAYDNYNTPYGPDSSTSGEKEDLDVFTAKMARIGHL